MRVPTLFNPSDPLPVKIALIRQRYTAFGGAERFVERALAALKAQGAEVTVVTREWTKSSNNNLSLCNPFFLGRIWRDWSFGKCACGITQHRFDLVQSHERLPCADIYRAGDGVHREWLNQRRRVLSNLQRIWLAINPYQRYVLHAESKLYASPLLKAIICNSYMVKEEIRRHFDLPEHQLHVVYNGIDTGAFAPALAKQHRSNIRRQLGIPVNAPVFLFIGSGYERKGLRQALLSFAQQADSTHLIIVGKDKHEPRYRRLAASLGVEGRAHFLGSQKEVLPYYGAADACVLPTLYDPFPNVALEAMATGLPLLTSSKSGAAEIVQEGVNGFICDALDTTTLARNMQQLCDPARASSMGIAARASAEKLGLEEMGVQLLAIYTSLLTRKQEN